jgi:transposase
VWALDEHRVGLKPILRSVWAKRGKRPIARVWPRYQWRWVYGFVRPETGETDFWISGHADSLTLEAILPAFAARRNGPTVLVLDQAGYHLAGRVREAMEALSITPMWLPAYSPELQPAERLWPLVDAPLSNRTFDSIDELEGLLSEQCVRLCEQTERIQSLTLYHWWPGGTDHEPEP